MGPVISPPLTSTFSSIMRWKGWRRKSLAQKVPSATNSIWNSFVIKLLFEKKSNKDYGPVIIVLFSVNLFNIWPMCINFYWSTYFFVMGVSWHWSFFFVCLIIRNNIGLQNIKRNFKPDVLISVKVDASKAMIRVASVSLLHCRWMKSQRENLGSW